MRRIPSTLLAFLLLPALAGCVDEPDAGIDGLGAADAPADPAGRPLLLAGKTDWNSALLAWDYPLTCDADHPDAESTIDRSELPPVPRNTTRIAALLELSERSTGLRVGVAFEGGPIEWSEAAQRGYTLLEVPVGPDQWERQPLRWSLYLAHEAPDGVTECGWGATVSSFRYAFFALPEGVPTPNF